MKKQDTELAIVLVVVLCMCSMMVTTTAGGYTFHKKLPFKLPFVSDSDSDSDNDSQSPNSQSPNSQPPISQTTETNQPISYEPTTINRIPASGLFGPNQQGGLTGSQTADVDTSGPSGRFAFLGLGGLSFTMAP